MAIEPTRRDLLIGALSLAALPSARADDLDEIRAIGAKAGLPPFRPTRTDHFQGIGDAPAVFQTEALSAAEAIAAEFLSHFKDKGFEPLATPKERMTVVVLSSPAAYGRFNGEPGDDFVGGHYDVEKNRLVVFDFRRGGRPLNAEAERINSRTLAHETAHQLCHNVGLLDRAADVPAFVNEGLGTYAETWRPKGRGRIGQINMGWLDFLKTFPDPWLEFDRLVADDRLFEGGETRARAYAQAWIFTHRCLKTPAILPKYRAYVETLRKRRDAKNRAADFETAFGDPARLGEDLKRYARRPTGT